ncbi:MAG: hypothetical protein J5758_02840, partial [Abditibacteriota bacterium]|nr:hypothetical protein [Abditibacteriota bacterium]
MLYRVIIILMLCLFTQAATAEVFVYSFRQNDFLLNAVSEAFGSVTSISADELASLKGSGNDVLAVVGAPYYPQSALPALRTFLEEGNNYLGISGLPFTEPLRKAEGKWMTAGELNLRATALATEVLAPLSDMKTEDFILNSSEGLPAVTLEPENGMLHIRAPRVAEWQTYTLKRINQTDIDDNSIISFSAKGSLRSPAIWIFLQEKDGSRWNRKVELTGEKRDYAFSARDFTYWQDSRSKGRGLEGDSLHLSNLDLAELSIMAAPAGEGVSLLDTVIGSPADIYISDIRYVRTEGEASFAAVPDMHAVYPAYEMHATEGSVLKDQAGEAFPGFARITSPLWRNQGFGTEYGGAFRQVPLAVLYSGDEMRGISAEAVYNYNGDHQNVCVYIGNDEEYLEKHPDYTAGLLRAAADRLTGAPFIVCGGARDFSVMPGEKPALGMTVRSKRDAVCRAEVLLLDETGAAVFSRSRQLRLTGGEDSQFTEKAPARKEGFYTAVCRLYGGDGRLLDKLEMPFSVYAPEKRTAFNSVTQHDGDFWLKGKKWVPYGIN